MPAVPLRIYRSSFMIRAQNCMLLRGTHLHQVTAIRLEAPGTPNVGWGSPSFEPPIKRRYMIISGIPFFYHPPDPPPDDPFVLGDLTVTLMSRYGPEHSLRIPVFYQAF